MAIKKQIFTLIILSIYQLVFSQNGNALFDDTLIHNIQINSIDPYTYEQFHDILDKSHEKVFWSSESKNYYKASVNIDGVTLGTIGVRYKGNSSYEFAEVNGKYALKLDFNKYVKGQKYDGLKKVNLNNNLLDPSCMRAKLSFDILERMGIVVPRTAYAKVYINGSYRGLYTMVEQIDKTFVRKNFDVDKTGYLHKAHGFSIGPRQSTLDSELSIWMPLKTKKKSKNYQPIKDFVFEANNANDTQFENDINNTFNLDVYVKQQAVNMVLSDIDHYCSGSWNFYMYQNPLTNKWYMIPWDYDLAFGATIHITDPTDHIRLQNYCFLAEKMLSIPNLKAKYYDALCEVVNFGMEKEWINNRINTIKNLIASEVENDPHFWAMDNFENYLDATYVTNAPSSGLHNRAIPGIRAYINNRYEQVTDDLSKNGYSCDLQLGTLNTEDIAISKSTKIDIFPNPVTNFVYLKGVKLDVNTIKIYNTLGQNVKIEHINKIDDITVQIDLSNLNTGIYFIKIGTSFNKVYKI